jgi:UDP-4-amino-4-deoxy-L-arabinose formyltransferase/UDP-glucuronic acid dehydrogenase (UDP-4-keto-hexauronic acid decarboxylating)
MKILILGVNGFIGNSLVKAIMEKTDWDVYGMDLSCSKLEHSFGNPRFHFVEGDISINREWVEYHIKKCDVVLPLVAIATPMTYVKAPLRVFELDFEENLKVIRQCVRYEKRIVFPSTSEVYGMCADTEFYEDTSNLVLGPIQKQRWIYACAKQLLDRVIWAYGESAALKFTLFRPFNWIGPKLDDIYAAKIGSSRVVTQIIIDIVRGQPIKLVDGGSQKRCFTYIDDGINCLMKIIEDKDSMCNSQIFNIGNPENECSIRDLAHKLIQLAMEHSACKRLADSVKVIEVTADNYYGKGYQDISSRKPSIRKAQILLKWTPQVSLEQALKATFDFFVEESIANGLL